MYHNRDNLTGRNSFIATAKISYLIVVHIGFDNLAKEISVANSLSFRFRANLLSCISVLILFLQVVQFFGNC